MSEGRLFIVALLACGWPNNKSYKWSDTRKLMEYGIEQYQFCKVKEKEITLPELEVVQGQTKEIGERAETSVQIRRIVDHTVDGDILMKEGERVDTKCTFDRIKQAPVQKGETAGRIDYYVDGELYLSEELIIEQTILKIDYFWCMKKILEKMILTGH